MAGDQVTSAWSVNMEVISRRWPVVAARLTAAERGRATVVNGTLFCRGTQVTSAYDRKAEAQAQASAMPNPARCYGIGLGDLPRLLLDRGGIHVVLPSLEIASASLAHERHEWLSSDRMQFSAASDVDWMADPFVCVAMECWLADEQGYEVRDRVFIKIHEAIQRARLRIDGDRIQAQFEENARNFQYPVSVLYGCAPRSKAVVVGAGPSLTGELEWLRTSGCRPVVACLTALRPLLAAGITPDIAVVMESDLESVRYLDGLDMARLIRTPLCYNPEADPRLVVAWPGAKCHAGELYLGGTVLHTCVDLATRMGAAEVTLLGFDCCRPRGESYAAGVNVVSTYPDDPMRMWTKDGHGKRVSTLPSMTQWQRRMEDLIAARPSVKFYKRGRAGVPLKGATWSDQ